MPANRFIPLFSTQSGAVPTASALYQGELAINVADGRLFTRSGSAIVLLNSRVSSSYAQTSSYALNAGSGVGFPFSGSAVITGSLLVQPSGSIGGITGSFSGSFVGQFNGTATSASYVEYNNVVNKPSLVSSSDQVSLTATSGYSTFSSSIATKNDLQDVSINALNAATSSYAINATIQGQLADVVSSSTQVKPLLPGGTVSSSAQYPGWVTASSQIDYNNIQNKLSGVVSSSVQVQPLLPGGTVSSSGQVDITSTTNYSTFSSSLATVDAGQTTRIDNLASLTSSYAINSTIQGQLAGVVSSSAQVKPLLPDGTVTSSAQYPGWVTASSQIDYNSIQNKLSGVVSSSTQIVPLLPEGTISASSQVALNAITGVTFSNSSFYFPNNLRVEGTITAQEINTEYVSSSIIYESGSTKFGDSADDVMSVTGSIRVLAGTISGSMVGMFSSSAQVDYNSIQNKLSGVVSSSTQVQPLLPGGTVSSSTQYPGWVTASGQVDITLTNGYSTFSSSLASVDAGQTTRIDNLASLTSSYAINATIQSQLAGVVSSSTQVKPLLPGGTVSSSAQYPGWVTASSQIDYNSITNKLSGVVSSSAQVAPLLPGGTVSSSTQVQPLLPGGTVSSSAQYPGWVTSSAQVSYTQLQNIPFNIFSSSNFEAPTQGTARLTFNGNQTVDIDLGVQVTDTPTFAGVTSSLFGTSSVAVSSSYAQTSSYALNAGAGAGFPFSGSAVITGSLQLIDTANRGGITGSLLGTASNAVNATNAVTASYAINADTAIGINVDNHSFVGNGVTTNYTLSQSYAIISLNVSVDGLTLTPVVDYSIAGTTLSLVSAPPSESNVFVKAWSNATQNVNGSFTGSFIGTLNGDMTGSAKFNTLPNIAIKGDTHLFIGNGVTTAYTLSSSYDDSVVFVSVDGMTQALIEDFSISGTTLNLVTAPPSASNVVVKAVRLVIS